MSDNRVVIEINDNELTEALLESGAEVEVEEALDKPDAASVTVAMSAQAGGNWVSLIDELAAPDAELRIGVSGRGEAYNFSGLVIGASWTMDARGLSQLVVQAMDRSVEMDRVEQVTPWPGTADSAIASTIFAAYGFGAQVEPTPSGPSPDAFTPIQRGTDWEFLRALAAKWGYAMFLQVEGDKVVGNFRPIDALAVPSSKLQLGFGRDSYSASVEVDFDVGGAVRAARIPPLSASGIEGEAEGADQLQGDEPISVAASTLLSPAEIDGEVDPFETTKAQARQRAFGVRLRTTTNPHEWGPLVRARTTVDVVGLGDRLSGLYLAESVRHRLSHAHHEQEIVLVSNALGASGGLLGGLL